MSDEQTPTRTFLVDWHAAELAAVEHMRTLGFIDAQATAPGADGGIDAQSNEAAAQVKFYANPIGRPEIQRLRGAAHEYRLALFYSLAVTPMKRSPTPTMRGCHFLLWTLTGAVSRCRALPIYW